MELVTEQFQGFRSTTDFAYSFVLGSVNATVVNFWRTNRVEPKLAQVSGLSEALSVKRNALVHN
eukprot:65290-Amphidinium_carterae.1